MAARGDHGRGRAAAIRANNFQSAPGQAKGYFTVTNITANTGLTTSTSSASMVVKAEGGAPGPAQRRRHRRARRAEQQLARCAMNGQHAVFIGINATPTGNPLTIVKGVRDAAADHRARPAADARR